MEQSVCMSWPVARPCVHILPNSPVTAKAAVAKPSRKAPATADLRYALTMVYLLGVVGFLSPTFLHPVAQPDATLSHLVTPVNYRANRPAWPCGHGAPTEAGTISAVFAGAEVLKGRWASALLGSLPVGQKTGDNFMLV